MWLIKRYFDTLPRLTFYFIAILKKCNRLHLLISITNITLRDPLLTLNKVVETFNSYMPKWVLHMVYTEFLCQICIPKLKENKAIKPLSSIMNSIILYMLALLFLIGVSRNCAPLYDFVVYESTMDHRLCILSLFKQKT